ncbi:hypothetical protein MSG28_006623 [Choristoneura fumiferana]|uniref:Uncharacterized protein n=1 Tax=Choristoneura fumiferana TaxID=7141 RepID=A0ACC0JFE9_CHOFU|nr:hypothetical protein MSG28_006623 [Choristoneura fumiferana]
MVYCARAQCVSSVAGRYARDIISRLSAPAPEWKQSPGTGLSSGSTSPVLDSKGVSANVNVSQRQLWGWGRGGEGQQVPRDERSAQGCRRPLPLADTLDKPNVSVHKDQHMDPNNEAPAGLKPVTWSDFDGQCKERDLFRYVLEATSLTLPATFVKGRIARRAARDVGATSVTRHLTSARQVLYGMRRVTEESELVQRRLCGVQRWGGTDCVAVYPDDTAMTVTLLLKSCVNWTRRGYYRIDILFKCDVSFMEEALTRGGGVSRQASNRALLQPTAGGDVGCAQDQTMLIAAKSKLLNEFRERRRKNSAGGGCRRGEGGRSHARRGEGRYLPSNVGIPTRGENVGDAAGRTLGSRRRPEVVRADVRNRLQYLSTLILHRVTERSGEDVCDFKCARLLLTINKRDVSPLSMGPASRAHCARAAREQTSLHYSPPINAKSEIVWGRGTFTPSPPGSAISGTPAANGLGRPGRWLFLVSSAKVRVAVADCHPSPPVPSTRIAIDRRALRVRDSEVSYLRPRSYAWRPRGDACVLRPCGGPCIYLYLLEFYLPEFHLPYQPVGYDFFREELATIKRKCRVSCVTTCRYEPNLCCCLLAGLASTIAPRQLQWPQTPQLPQMTIPR